MYSLPQQSPPKLHKKPGPKPKSIPIPVPTVQELHLDEQDPNKQASSVRHDAYKLSKLAGRDILQAMHDNIKIGLKDLFIMYGIAADKVLSGTESAGLTLCVPLQLVEKLVIAVQSKAQSVQVVDKMEK